MDELAGRQGRLYPIEELDEFLVSAALVIMRPELDASYRAIRDHAYAWPAPLGDRR